MTAREPTADVHEKPAEQVESRAVLVLTSRLVSVAEDLHCTALDIEERAERRDADIEELAEAVEEAEQELEALVWLASVNGVGGI